MRKIDSNLENPIDNILIDICDFILPTLKVLNFTPNMLTTISLIFGLLSVYCLFEKIKNALQYFI